MEQAIQEWREEQLVLCRRRLVALAAIESKLREMRELAVYAASRSLHAGEAAQIQEWILHLQQEVQQLDTATRFKYENEIVL